MPSIVFRFALQLISFILFTLVMLSSAPVNAQTGGDIARLEVPSTFNPVGSGARALGLGGAFIAMANDATAASWNPANLIRIRRPKLAVVGAYLNRTEDNQFDITPSASGKQSVTDTNLNYLALSYPFQLFGRNMVLSLNYQHLFDFNRDWELHLQQQAEGSLTKQHLDYAQEGQLYALGVAYALEILPNRLYLGTTFNIWKDLLFDNEWRQSTQISEQSWITGPDIGGNFRSQTRQRAEFGFSGFNVNLGLRWVVIDAEPGEVIFGLIAKTGFDADIDETSEFQSISGSVADPDISTETVERQTTLTMPWSYGFGLSYQASRRLTVGLDVYRTEWDDFVQTLENGDKISPLSGLSVAETDIGATTQVRAGGEYRLAGQGPGPIRAIPLRLGFFYDPVPADEGSDDFYGIATGIGIDIGRVVFDVAYQYRYGQDVTQGALEAWGFSQDVKEHQVYFSSYLRL